MSQVATTVRVQYTEEVNTRISWESIQEYQHFQELYGEDAQSLVAFETDGIAGVTYGPVDGIVDPHSVTFTYLRLAKERGASIYLQTPMISATGTGKAWRVETPRDIFEAEYLINAAGSWAGDIGRRAGLEAEVPVQPVRRLVFMTTPTPWQHSVP